MRQIKADNDPVTEGVIRSLEPERRLALLKQDRSALDRMYATDMSTIDNDGELHSNLGKDAVLCRDRNCVHLGHHLAGVDLVTHLSVLHAPQGII
jgi:hypothetical protein